LAAAQVLEVHGLAAAVQAVGIVPQLLVRLPAAAAVLKLHLLLCPELRILLQLVQAVLVLQLI
jgi:hypothetical protein